MTSALWSRRTSIRTATWTCSLARAIPGSYPLVGPSRLLRNDGGRFVDATAEVAPGLESVGLVTAALWTDADLDGDVDLLIATEWGPVHYWTNNDGQLTESTGAAGLAERLGWWSSLCGVDLDSDGDTDYVVLNAGLNTKYGSKEAHLFYGLFEGEEQPRIIEAKHGADELLPVRGLSCSSGAMPRMNAEIPTYRQFAGATLEEIYGLEPLNDALELTANHLESGVLINVTEPGEDARFEYRPLPRIAQIAPGYGAVSADFDLDGQADVALVQNFYGREPETGRWAGGLGLVLLGDGAGNLIPQRPDESGFVVPGDGTALTTCDIDDDGAPDLVAAQNEGRVMCFTPVERIDWRRIGWMAVRLIGPDGNRNAVGARVTLTRMDGRQTSAEVYAGSGHASQSAACLFFGGLEEEFEEHRKQGGPSIRVRWADGSETRYELPPSGDQLTIHKP